VPSPSTSAVASALPSSLGERVAQRACVVDHVELDHVTYLKRRPDANVGLDPGCNGVAVGGDQHLLERDERLGLAQRWVTTAVADDGTS
jgi:hypothetical protein